MVSSLFLQGVVYAFTIFAVYNVLKYVYRLTFHPLAKFPGPKLAAVTTLYNAYYDIFTPGLIKRLPEMHMKYGPIIRIQPNELHIGDLDGYNQIFRVGTPFDRIWHNNIFLTGSLQSLRTLQDTKKRKEFFSSFFSKTAISRVEPLLHRQKLKQFLDTLQNSVENNGGRAIIDFYLGFRCLTADTVMDYCFQNDLNALASPDFQDPTVNAFIEGFDMALLGAHFPNFFGMLNNIILALPEEVRAKYFAPVYGFQTMQKLARERVEYLIANPEKTNSKVPTMFDAMLNPDTKKGQVTPSMHDMTADGCLMIAAGTDTTTNSLGVVLWHVTQNPDVEAKLVAELKQAIPDHNMMVDSATLEGDGFEYMRAVVKESLRLSIGVPGRIIRLTPKGGAYFSGQFVPGGTVVTSGQYLQNMDPVTFPDPSRFDPERWLCDSETYKTRDRQMLSFSRGSRSCIGINLAYASLHLTTTHLFRRFKIVTTGYTTEHDMDWNDRFVPVPNGRIKGLVRMREN